MILDNKYTLYFPAISVGSFLSTVKKDIKHFKNNRSFRYYSKKVDPLFYYPYILISAAHNFEELNIREEMGFNRGEGLFFGDSGGYQLLTGKVPKKFNRESSFKWLEKNSDVFPLLDKPFPKNYTAMPKNIFDDSLNFTIDSAKYFLDNRTNKDTIILNVIQGRDLSEIEKWYKGVSPYKFEGWAFGGYNLTQIMSCFFYLLGKGELDESKIFHIFMLSKAKYMIYLIYLQTLLHKEKYPLVISYDSSYPIIQTIFGNFFLYSTLTGFKSITFSNKFDYSKLQEENKIPCNCSVCEGVPLKEFVDFASDRFYSLCAGHNLLTLINYKKFLENIFYTDSFEIFQEIFSSTDIKILRIIKNAFDNRNKTDNYKDIYMKLQFFVENELDNDLKNSMMELF